MESTAGIIIIGDEIIKGKVQDTNSHFLAQKLYSLGVDVCKISVIPDQIDVIAQEVALFSAKYTHVITAGGVGPTHDDMTYQGIARGLGEDLIMLPALVKLIQSHFKKVQVPVGYDPLNPPTFAWDVDTSTFNPALKMALVPVSSRLHFSDFVSSFPLVQAGNNVYILPGIPEYMRRGAQHLEKLCRNPNRTYHSRAVYLLSDEVQLAPVLNEVVRVHAPHVSFGSYPVLGNNYYRTRLTMESSDTDRLETAHSQLKERLPSESIVSNYEPDPIQRADQVVEQILNDQGDSSNITAELRQAVTSAHQVIEECLSRYGPEEVCVSFNGGKDCSALLHLVYASWKKKRTSSDQRLRALYIRSSDPFPEMEQFVQDTRQRYDLELWTVPGPIRSGLASALESHPDVKAILMGTRRSDPYAANLQAFQMTDPGWPSVMRVSPILDWTYQQVWLLLRRLSLPYCVLYDQGYTSVGNRGNTQPNPALRVVDTETGRERYQPAYFLNDCLTERQGRL